MDFLGSRAIPALIGALLALPIAGFAADCSIDGAYQFRSQGAKDDSDSFSRLVELKQGEGQKLFKLDEAQKTTQGWGAGELKSRPKYTVLATRVEVAGSRARFLDASGKTLLEASLDSGGKWACKGGRLQRSSERMAGVGNEIRTDRLEEALHRDGEALVFDETRTTIDPPGGKPRTRQVRFAAAR